LFILFYFVVIISLIFIVLSAWLVLPPLFILFYFVVLLLFEVFGRYYRLFIHTCYNYLLMFIVVNIAY